MKTILYTVLIIGATACGNPMTNQNSASEENSSGVKTEVAASSQGLEPLNMPEMESSLGLTKKARSHDCTCTIKDTEYSLSGCVVRFELRCVKSIGKDKIIALQFYGVGSGVNYRIWYAR